MWLLLRNPHSWALSLTASIVREISLSLLVSLSLGAILWPSELLSSRILHDLDTYGSVDPLGVFPLFLKKDADIIVRTP